MRVLAVGNIFPPHDFGGGYEAVWEGAVHHLHERGHTVRVLTTDFRSGSTLPERADVVRELRWYWEDHAYPQRTFRQALRIERHNLAVFGRELADFAPDIVSWWSMGGLSLSLLEVGRRAGVPAAAFVHDDWLDYGRRADDLHRRLRRRRYPAPVVERTLGVPGRIDFSDAAHYAFVSATTRSRAEKSGLVLADTSVVPSGISDVFEAAPAKDWTGRLLYVGRIDPRKGLNTAVEALPHLPGTVLRVVGDGPPEYVEALRQLAESAGVAGRLELVGPLAVESLPAEYGAADAVIFPVMWQEPWGLVPLESMAIGRPVVATGRGGSGEYLVDGHNALLFDAGDAGALAAQVERLAASPELRARLHEAGLETAEEHRGQRFDRAVEDTLARTLAAARAD